jgi:hypothetical protein
MKMSIAVIITLLAAVTLAAPYPKPEANPDAAFVENPLKSHYSTHDGLYGVYTGLRWRPNGKVPSFNTIFPTTFLLTYQI